MTLAALARRFFGLSEPDRSGNALMITGPRKSGPPYVDHHANRTRRPLGVPGQQGMVVVNDTPPKTVDQVRAEQAKLPPRTWKILEGHGMAIGTAVEDPGTKIVRVHWNVLGKQPARTQWVDEEAFRWDMLAAGPESFPVAHGFTLPLRVRFQPRTDAERLGERLKAEGHW